MPSWSVALLALAGVASARQCQDITVHVSLQARNARFNLEPLETQMDVTNFYLGLARQGGCLMNRTLAGVWFSFLPFLIQELICV